MDINAKRDPRGQMLDDAETVALIDNPDSTEEIPTLDFAPYLQGRAGGMEAVAARLREISMTVGFFYLKNHDVPQDVLDQAFAASRQFHALPAAEKERLAVVKADGMQSGYRNFAGQAERVTNVNLISEARPNYAQYSVRREPDIQRAMKPDLAPGDSVNVWPTSLPSFRPAVLAYHAAIEKLALSFLPLWSHSLKLPLDYFDGWFRKPHLQMGLLHYPPQLEVGNRQYGIAPHTDNAMMTFLAQSSVPGLAVRMPSGHWRAVEPVPGTLLVNTGNTIVQWTNEEYLSTKHRVINTNTVDRYSIPIFFGPEDGTIIQPVPTSVGPDRPPLYQPITYGDLRAWYYGGARN